MLNEVIASSTSNNLYFMIFPISVIFMHSKCGVVKSNIDTGCKHFCRRVPVAVFRVISLVSCPRMQVVPRRIDPQIRKAELLKNASRKIIAKCKGGEPQIRSVLQPPGSLSGTETQGVVIGCPGYVGIRVAGCPPV